MADVAVIWARDEDGEYRGFLVETDSPGFQAVELTHKLSMRLSNTSQLFLDNVTVSDDARLPEGNGLRAPLQCLTQARYGIAWGAMGAARAAYEEALNYAQQREAFGGPIASRQIIQERLVNMLTELTKGQLLAYRLGRLKDEGKMKYAQVSMAKRNNVRKALEIARDARTILGAYGITLGHHAMRHAANLETVDTYEGTYDIHTLILGREITGTARFSGRRGRKRPTGKRTKTYTRWTQDGLRRKVSPEPAFFVRTYYPIAAKPRPVGMPRRTAASPTATSERADRRTAAGTRPAG